MKDRIKQLVAEAKDINYCRGDWREKDGTFWAKVKALEIELGKGLKPGRHVKWNVADGYAHYFVVKVGKMFTELAFIPYGDQYQFAGTFILKGKLVAPTTVVEQSIKWDDASF